MSSGLPAAPNGGKIQVHFVHFSSRRVRLWRSAVAVLRFLSRPPFVASTGFPAGQNPIHFQATRQRSLLRPRQSWGVSALAAGRRGRWEGRVSLEGAQAKSGSVMMRGGTKNPSRPADRRGETNLPRARPAVFLRWPFARQNPAEATLTGQGRRPLSLVYKKTCISGSVRPPEFTSLTTAGMRAARDRLEAALEDFKNARRVAK